VSRTGRVVERLGNRNIKDLTGTGAVTLKANADAFAERVSSRPSSSRLHVKTAPRWLDLGPEAGGGHTESECPLTDAPKATTVRAVGADLLGPTLRC